MLPTQRAPLLEVCVDSAAAAQAAQEGGADRVELCAGLSEGGLTPSAGSIACARARVALGLVVLLRPRAGDFLYSELEFEVMKHDLRSIRDSGADGVAFGLLRPDGAVDRDRTGELIQLARPLTVTFHRAFDMSRDPFEALQELCALGVERVLTSGCEGSVSQGLAVVRQLVSQAGSRIAVVAAGGVREENVRRVLAETGVRELHFTARTDSASAMLYRNPRCRMGSAAAPGEYELEPTEAERVRRIRDAAQAGPGP